MLYQTNFTKREQKLCYTISYLIYRIRCKDGAPSNNKQSVAPCRNGFVLNFNMWSSIQSIRDSLQVNLVPIQGREYRLNSKWRRSDQIVSRINDEQYSTKTLTEVKIDKQMMCIYYSYFTFIINLSRSLQLQLYNNSKMHVTAH